MYYLTLVSRLPMLGALLPLVAGIAAQRPLQLPWWAACACMAVTAAAAWLTGAGRHARYGRWGVFYAFAAIFFMGVLLAELNRPTRVLPVGEKVEMQLRLTGPTYAAGRWRRADARVVSYLDGGRWAVAGEKIVVYVDSAYGVEPFRTVHCRGWINPVDTAGGSYGRLMAVRGFFNRTYITRGNIISVDRAPVRTPRYYAARMQDRAVERLARLDLAPREADVVRTMAAGAGRGVDSDLRRAYSAAGAAHLLAVSGLHVGMVFVLVNVLLMPLTLLRRGHVWRSAAAVAAIVGFAVMSGMSPSAMRAALMFSMAQIALAASRPRSSLNILFASAFILLVADPNYLRDVSFQLSYAAVLSILLFYGPLYRPLRSRYRAVNALTGVMVVGVTATVGTAPLVAWYFGSFPVVGMLLNPVVIVTAHVIVIAGILWIMAPVALLRPLAAWAAGGAARFQNAVVEWSSRPGWASPQVEMPLWAVLACYAVLVAGALWYYRSELR